MNVYYITGLREWERRQWPFIITTGMLKWQNVSVPTKDLMLFNDGLEGKEASLKRICGPRPN